MKIDLNKYNCERFRVILSFSVREGCIDEFRTLVASTLNRSKGGDDTDGLEAVFVSSYTLQGNHFGVLVTVRCDDIEAGTGAVFFDFVEFDEPLPRQRRKARPVSRLVSSASEMLDISEGFCRASFLYEEAEGFWSKSSLPIPLAVQEYGDGVTHIESATFVRREGDKIKYGVSVRKRGGTIAHQVNFDMTNLNMKIKMDRRSFADVLREASSHSMQLVKKNKGEKDDVEQDG